MSTRARFPALRNITRLPETGHAPMLALAAASAVLIATLLYHSRDGVFPVPGPVAGTERQTKQGPTPPVNAQTLRQMSSWHLFGTAAPVRTARVEAPETVLNLKLRGVFYTPGKTGGHAIIASAGGVEKQYAIGDRLPGNARLQAVLRYKVIIERAGRLESLSLPVAQESDAAALAAPRRIPDAGSVAQVAPSTAQRQNTPVWAERADR